MNLKKLSLLLAISVFVSANTYAQVQNSQPFNPEDESYSESCTSIMVTKGASEDGSVITSHTCDSNYRTWLKIEESKTFKLGEFDPIRWGTMHNEEPWDPRGITIKGEIPAPKEPTFRYLNTSYPCLNEKQLAMGETTTEGKKELVNKKGLFLIEELERIALQRCSTARDAVELIGKLAHTYGYGDWGECLTIADTKEIWHFEVYGSGPGKPSALWAAQRIPDGQVGVSANIPRIGIIDFNDTENFMFSPDLKERSKKLGYWDGKSPYKFYKVVTSSKKNFSVREYFIFNTLAPSLKLSYDMEELPFTITPDKKVSLEEVFALYRSTYDGTEYDQVRNLSVEVNRRKYVNGERINYKDTVSPISTFMPADIRALLNKLEPGVTERTRTIAVIQCAYSHIIQLRDWLPDAVGGVAYFAFDNPAQSPRIPIYAGTTSLPKSFEICAQHRYRPEAAAWAFRETNRISTINWDKTRGIIEPEVLRLQEEMLLEREMIDKRAAQLIKEGKEDEAKELLTNHTHDFADKCINKWQELKAKIWTIFARSM